MNAMTPINVPLFAEIERPEKFPIESCGELAPVVEAVADATQVPKEMAWHAVLEAVTLSVQAKANWLNPYKIETALVLFILTGAESGDRKTGASNRASAGAASHARKLRNRQIIQQEIYQNKVTAYNSVKKNLEKSIKDMAELEAALNNLGHPPKPPLKSQLIFKDTTIEAIASVMRGGQPSAIFSTSEGGIFSGGHSFSKEKRVYSQAVLNSIWDGGPIGSNRVTTDAEPLYGRRLSVAVMFQPGLLMEFIGDETAINQGFFARFLIAMPTSIAGTRIPATPSQESLAIIEKFNKRTEALLDAPLKFKDGSDELELRSIEMSEKAEALFLEFATYCEANLGLDGELYPIRDFANKAAENAGRLAAIMTLFENKDAKEISYNHTLNAITLMHWYLSETLRLREATPISRTLRQAQELLTYLIKYAAKNDTSTILFRDITRSGPKKLRPSNVLNPLIKELMDSERLLEIKQSPRTFKIVVE